MEEKKKEGIINNFTIVQKLDIVITAAKSLCKILARDKVSTGFLIKLLKGVEDFFCLMTNEHLITKDMIKNKEKIKFYYDNESKSEEIYLNKEERFIKEFTDIKLDVTIVEILSKDNISKEYFLLPCTDYMNDYKCLINEEIAIIHYPTPQLGYSDGKIKNINKNEIIFLSSIKPASSGNPIFIKDTNKVIGIHKGCKYINSDNCTDLIGPIFNYFSNIKKQKGSIKHKNGEYYIVEFLYGKPHGKGIEYYKNGNIKYEGDFFNGKREGNGKYIYEDGDYYIGEWKNDLEYGKGIIYYKNGNIKYEGDFINSKFEGNGIYIWENGEYYIGDFKNGLFHGKGIVFYKNGNIKYRGNFINGELVE